MCAVLAALVTWADASGQENQHLCSAWKYEVLCCEMEAVGELLPSFGVKVEGAGESACHGSQLWPTKAS